MIMRGLASIAAQVRRMFCTHDKPEVYSDQTVKNLTTGKAVRTRLLRCTACGHQFDDVQRYDLPQEGRTP